MTVENAKEIGKCSKRSEEIRKALKGKGK